MNRKTFPSPVVSLEENQRLVYFGNTVGRIFNLIHRKFGACHGVIEGKTGNCYAIPAYIFDQDEGTKGPESKEFLLKKINRLYLKALDTPEIEYLVSYHGADLLLCRYSKPEMADLFSAFGIPDNVIFDDDFNKYIK